MTARAVTRLLLLLCTLAAGTARAQTAAGATPDAVLLDLVDCGDVRAEDVRALVALELAPRLRLAGVADAQPALTASLRCDTGTLARITVAEPADAKPLSLELDLARSAPAARTRLLALSIAELIATRRLEKQGATAQTAARAKPASESESESDSDSDSEPDSESDSDTPAQPASAHPAFRLWIGPGLSRAAEPATTLLGASLGASRTFGMFALSSELQARFGRAELSDADVGVQVFSASLALAPQLTRGPLAFSAGAGMRAGYARLAADSTRPELEGDTLARGWFGPLALAALDIDIARPGSLRFGLEAGYVLRGVDGQDARDQTLLALRGLWISALAAVALAM